MLLKNRQSEIPIHYRKSLTLPVALVLSIVSFLTIAATCNDLGWTWDEVYYFLSSELQVEWFKAFLASLFNGNLDGVLSRKVIDEYWLWDITHNPHPPFYKILSSISWVLFKDNLGDFISYRLAAAFLSGVLILFLFLTIEKAYGLIPGIVGSLSLLVMPRFFGHAHLATTEIPLATLWFLCYWAFWRGLTHISASLLLGIFFGCALAVKFTAVLIPFPFLLWTVMYREKRAVRNIIFIILVSPLITILVNPGWWYQPFLKIFTFVQMSLARQQTIAIGTFFMGKNHIFSPPWFYPLIMTAITIPLSGILTILLGAAYLLKEKLKNVDDNLFLLNIPFIFLVVMHPHTPVHDGIRQFFPLLPFLAYLSAIGFYYLTQIVFSLPVRRSMQKGVISVCLLFLLGYPVLELKNYHPYELSYYNQLIGGLSGAYRKGMELTYWFDALNNHFLNIFSDYVPDGTGISVWPPNVEYFTFLQDKGKIKKDLKFYNPDVKVIAKKNGIKIFFEPEQPEYLILLSRLGSFNLLYWGIFKNEVPLFSLEMEGIPLVSVYRWRDIIGDGASKPYPFIPE